MALTTYHKSRCSESRATLKLLHDRGLDPKLVRYLDTPADPVLGIFTEH